MGGHWSVRKKGGTREMGSFEQYLGNIRKDRGKKLRQQRGSKAKKYHNIKDSVGAGSGTYVRNKKAKVSKLGSLIGGTSKNRVDGYREGPGLELPQKSFNHSTGSWRVSKITAKWKAPKGGGKRRSAAMGK